MATVFIPPVLQQFAGGQAKVEVPGRTLRQVFVNLEEAYPAMREQLVVDGDIRPGLAVAVDNEITAEGLVQVVEPDSEVRILPAVGGGSRA